MALSSCHVETNKAQKETIPHGVAMFPIACYEDDLNLMKVPWHWHDEFEFIWVTEGCMQIYIEHQSIPLRQGEAIFINSAILHSIDAENHAPCKCRSLVFHARFVGGGVESVFWQKLIVPLTQSAAVRCLCLRPSISWQSSVIKTVAAAWQAIADESEDFENEARFLLSKSFRLMISYQQRAAHIPPNRQEQINAERLKTMLCYIEENYQNEISLDMIARQAAISKSACLRCFRHTINSTPIRYLMQYRVEKAAEALQTTNAQIHEIAITCGFSDISYFSKCFREIKGCTPLDYRKAAQLARE